MATYITQLRTGQSGPKIDLYSREHMIGAGSILANAVHMVDNYKNNYGHIKHVAGNEFGAYVAKYFGFELFRMSDYQQKLPRLTGMKQMMLIY